MKVSEIIRQAMIDTGRNDNEISKMVKVSQPQLRAFRLGSNPKASTIDALAAWLGLTVTRVKKSKTNGPQS